MLTVGNNRAGVEELLGMICPARNGKPQPLPQAARYTLTITPPGTTTRQHHDQQQHATRQATTPNAKGNAVSQAVVSELRWRWFFK